jgi:hypothetical protein
MRVKAGVTPGETGPQVRTQRQRDQLDHWTRQPGETGTFLGFADRGGNV